MKRGIVVITVRKNVLRYRKIISLTYQVCRVILQISMNVLETIVVVRMQSVPTQLDRFPVNANLDMKEMDLSAPNQKQVHI